MAARNALDRMKQQGKTKAKENRTVDRGCGIVETKGGNL